MEHTVKTVRQARIPSTLLVPREMRSMLDNRLEEKSCGLPEYLRILLDIYGPLIASGGVVPSRKSRTLYQVEGQSPMPYSFRPGDEDWLELKMMAGSLGYSCCLLFIILFQMEVGLLDVKPDNGLVALFRNDHSAAVSIFLVIGLKKVNRSDGQYIRAIRMKIADSS